MIFLLFLLLEMKNICKILLFLSFWLSSDYLPVQINFAPQVLHYSSQGNNVHVTADFDNYGHSGTKSLETGLKLIYSSKNK